MRVPLALFAFAAFVPAVHAQPAEQRFDGPGWYCGGTYTVRLDWNDRATFQPPVVDMARTELRLAKKRVTITAGPGEPPAGRSIAKIGAADLRITAEGKKRVLYVLDDGQPFPLQISSPDFRGYAEDRWFFSHFVYEREDTKSVACLDAVKK
jgi:hypothetical protein